MEATAISAPLPLRMETQTCWSSHLFQRGQAVCSDGKSGAPFLGNVRQVTVNGKEGLFYQSGNYTEVVWLEGEVAVGLSYTAYIGTGTLERLEEYAQSLERCRPLMGS